MRNDSVFRFRKYERSLPSRRSALLMQPPAREVRLTIWNDLEVVWDTFASTA